MTATSKMVAVFLKAGQNTAFSNYLDMLVLLLSLIILLSSCPAESFRIENVPSPSPFELPLLEDAILLENRKVTLVFDRNVIIRDMRLDDRECERSSVESKLHTVRLPEAIPYGERRRLRFTIEDGRTGMLSRFSLPLMGINLNQAELIMTEISVKGTDSSPDRIELTVLSDGTTGSLTITDGVLEYMDLEFQLPDIRVRKGDTIVLYLSSPHKGEDVIWLGKRRIFNIDVEPNHSLLSTNGAVILYSHTNGNGRIMDSFLYRKSDTMASGGYGNEKTELTAGALERGNEWLSPGFISDENTSTRVFARRFPYADTNTEEDWYLTATRGSTFGYSNDNNEYVKPEEKE